jgi:hypothetical protein
MRKLTTAELIKVFAGELIKLSQHPKYRKDMEKREREEHNKEILRKYNKQQETPTPQTPYEKKIVDKISRPEKKKKIPKISNFELRNYLMNWHDGGETFSDLNLMLDRDLLDMAADYLVGAGAIDPENADKPEIEEAILERLAKYTESKKKSEQRDFFVDMEVWVDDDTGETSFIDGGDLDESVVEGLTFDSGYDETGKKYNVTRIQPEAV